MVHGEVNGTGTWYLTNNMPLIIATADSRVMILIENNQINVTSFYVPFKTRNFYVQYDISWSASKSG